jgi:uncharacterized protein YkwD
MTSDPKTIRLIPIRWRVIGMAPVWVLILGFALFAVTGRMIEAQSKEPVFPAAAELTPVAAPTPTFAEEVIRLVNVQRAAADQPPLKQAVQLSTAAAGHSTRMATADFFGHCDPGPPQADYVSRIVAAGYTNWNTLAENIAAGYLSPADVVAGWMASVGHRDNILSSSLYETGVGYYYQENDQSTVRLDNNGDCVYETLNQGPYRRYWTQDFGRRSSVWPMVIEGEASQTAALNVDLYLYRPTTPSQMRFRNEDAAWSAWQPFAMTARWATSPGNGPKTIYAEVYNASTTYVVNDTIYLNAPLPVSPAVGISNTPTAVSLIWVHQAADLRYDIYRAADHPYFAPGSDDSNLVGAVNSPPADGSAVTFLDSTAVFGRSYFYLVRATAGDGQTIADSNRTGRVAFVLVPGSQQ